MRLGSLSHFYNLGAFGIHAQTKLLFEESHFLKFEGNNGRRNKINLQTVEKILSVSNSDESMVENEQQLVLLHIQEYRL